MLQIRPVSDLRNKFPEIENAVKNGQPVYLTKNGYGVMVVMSLGKYAELTNTIDQTEAVTVEDNRHALLRLFDTLGAWEDTKDADEIITEMRESRISRKKDTVL